MSEEKKTSKKTPPTMVASPVEGITEAANMIASRMSGILPAFQIKQVISDALARAKDDSELQRIALTVKAKLDVNQDETVEFEVWSEVAQSKSEKSEKVGETIDLRQTSFKFTPEDDAKGGE